MPAVERYPEFIYPEPAKNMAKKHARPIKTKRDYKGAVLVAKNMLTLPNRESAEELRLQALIKEMERFDDQGQEEEDIDDVPDDLDGLPARRWSDDRSDA